MNEKNRSPNRPSGNTAKRSEQVIDDDAGNSRHEAHSRHHQSEQIFLALCDLPQAQRIMELERLAAEDVDLHRDVVAMLNHDQDGDPLFDQNPRLTKASQFDRLHPGDRVDSYEIVSVLGHGGMGVVYSARKKDLYENLVALKIVNSRSDSKGVIARFEAERKVLAMFAHPNLTQIFDGGLTDKGLPYFVMEYVPGKSVTSYCRDNAVDLQGRLAMFAKVCDAINHAHQKGVIHRDLKPSNILVTEIDGKAVPKVIDFGTAKSLDLQSIELKDGLTIAGDIIGTPLYMSPEQAGSGRSAVDVRSDVYSLGVVLYELLTGSTPLQLSDIDGLSSIKLLEAIRDYSVETPSMRVENTIGIEAMTGFQIQKRFLLKKLRGDLNKVVCKALAKDINIRYGSVAEFRSDIVSYISGKPVSAVPPSLRYWVGKFIRKHPWPVAITGVLSLGILAFASIAVLQAIENKKSLVENRTLVEQLKKKTADLEQTIKRAESAESDRRKAQYGKMYAAALERAALGYMSSLVELEENSNVEIDSSPPTEPLKEEPVADFAVDVASNVEEPLEMADLNFLETTPEVTTFYGQDLALNALGLRCLLPNSMRNGDFLPLIFDRPDVDSNGGEEPTETSAGRFCKVLLAEMDKEFDVENEYYGHVYCALAQSQLQCNNFDGALSSINSSIRIFNSTDCLEFELFASLIKCSAFSKRGDPERAKELATKIRERIDSTGIRSRKMRLIEIMLNEQTLETTE